MIRYLSVKEYAFERQVHPETVKRWIYTGRVQAVRTGLLGHWRIRTDDELTRGVEGQQFEDHGAHGDTVSL